MRRRRSAVSFASTPDPRWIPAVLGRDDRAELLDAPRHRAREAVDRRFLAERGLELGGIHRGDPAGVERADPLLQLERSGEGGLHGDLLVEREPDQERQRITGEELVGLVRVREVERLGHSPSVVRDLPHDEPSARRGAGHAKSAAIRSAIAAVVRFVFARGIVGMKDASATYRPSIPNTRACVSTTVPSGQVPAGWK